MFKTPFQVRLADPGMAFWDPVSKLRLTGTDVQTVKVMSPLTEQFIRGGGLIKVDGASEEQPEEPGTSTQEPSEPTVTASEGEQAPSAPSSLDELLAKAASEEEPAQKSKKK